MKRAGVVGLDPLQRLLARRLPAEEAAVDDQLATEASPQLLHQFTVSWMSISGEIRSPTRSAPTAVATAVTTSTTMRAPPTW
ncbi:hypothetical protein [Streptomyces bluensis]|uniref:Uncharacterized protein n=1 Tax=Streptomyces bluensis TaxID=33897 RepID=A0ABW6UBJ0_9ACTN